MRAHGSCRSPGSFSPGRPALLIPARRSGCHGDTWLACGHSPRRTLRAFPCDLSLLHPADKAVLRRFPNRCGVPCSRALPHGRPPRPQRAHRTSCPCLQASHPYQVEYSEAHREEPVDSLPALIFPRSIRPPWPSRRSLRPSCLSLAERIALAAYRPVVRAERPAFTHRAVSASHSTVLVASVTSTSRARPSKSSIAYV